MSTAISIVPGARHTLEGHPEHAGRLLAIQQLLKRERMLQPLRQVAPVPARHAQLRSVHTERHIDLIRWSAQRGGGMLGPDTYVRPGSYDEALLAAGSGCAVVDAVMAGVVDNGLALVRPPGHHAASNSAEGFCLFNNVAVVARHVQQAYGLERVAVIDFDVHHGNGTERVFYTDPTVLFVSSHLFAPFFYPGSGHMNDIGSGAGAGHTVNVPFRSGVGDNGYRAAFEQVIRPIVAAFKPQFILISAGFDAHWRDPLASASLSLTGYDWLCRELIAWADTLCDGRIVFILEGGYFLDALAGGVLNLVYALQRRTTVTDPLGPCPDPEQDISPLLHRLKQQHLLV